MLNQYNPDQIRGQQAPPAPPAPLLNTHANQLFESLCSLNDHLAGGRASLFGEHSESPPKDPNCKQASAPPLEASLGGIAYQLDIAHGQVSSIANRL
jgi:hypothetical protein